MDLARFELHDWWHRFAALRWARAESMPEVWFSLSYCDINSGSGELTVASEDRY